MPCFKKFKRNNIKAINLTAHEKDIKKIFNVLIDFFNFLVKMQKNFGKIKFNSQKITLAKAIDQYNYVKITLPGLATNKRKRNKAK